MEPIQIQGERNLYAKSPELIDEWSDKRLDRRVRLIARHFALDLEDLGAPAVITDVFRDDPKSVHSVGRGVDLRLSCSVKAAEKLREKYNRIFPYGKGKTETIPALDHGSAPHFHIQVRAL